MIAGLEGSKGSVVSGSRRDGEIHVFDSDLLVQLACFRLAVGGSIQTIRQIHLEHGDHVLRGRGQRLYIPFRSPIQCFPGDRYGILGAILKDRNLANPVRCFGSSFIFRGEQPFERSQGIVVLLVPHQRLACGERRVHRVLRFGKQL